MTILDKIIANKRKELIERKFLEPVCLLEKLPHFKRTGFSLKDELADPERTGIIAEFKRKSPSKGVINKNAGIREVVAGYEKAGAIGVSVLSDIKYFGGSDEDLIMARAYINIPLLRKDFIIDEYQIIEAKGLGADVILLIAAALSTSEIKKFATLAHSLGLETLLEIHSEKELICINDDIDVIGVNNRDLRDFTVDIEGSVKMAKAIPEDRIKISESGITDPATMSRLREAGYNGFLMGESFMKHADPVKAFAQFIDEVRIKNRYMIENGKT